MPGYKKMKNTKGGQPYFFIVFTATFLFIAGIFLCPNTPAQASELTAQSIIAGINAERQKIELATLTENSLLDAAAAEKARAIIARQEFSHTVAGKKFSAWIKETGYRYIIVGENLAIHFDDTEPLFNAWLASPAHKQNILHAEYTEVGIAILSGEWTDGPATVVVAVFAKPETYREQLVPTAGSAAPLITSNLTENYLQNIAGNGALPVIEEVAGDEVYAAVDQNKTALGHYFSLAAPFLVTYISFIFLASVIYFYSLYALSLAKNLRQIEQYQ